MQTVLTAQSTTFPVCPVERAKTPLETASWENMVLSSLQLEEKNRVSWHDFLREYGIQDPKMWFLTDFPKMYRLEAMAQNGGSFVATNGANPLVVAAKLAHGEHRPLVLSPDMIWLTILQGVAAHVSAAPEELRHHFVEFEKKKTLTVFRNWYLGEPNDWAGTFPEFSEQIRQNTRTGVWDNLLPRFSTTGPLEKAAMEVVLMRAMDSYFDYAMRPICGIPEITLEGSPEDWEKVERNAASLAQYDLEWWTKELVPLLHEFTMASKGEPNKGFWSKMVDSRSIDVFRGCGGGGENYLTGWLVKFFPYVLTKKNPWVTNPEAVRQFEAAIEADAKLPRNQQARDLLPHKFGLFAIKPTTLPGKMSKADVEFTDLSLNVHALEFCAGLVGLRQDPVTMALRPEMGWAIVVAGEKGGEKALRFYEKGLRGNPNVKLADYETDMMVAKTELYAEHQTIAVFEGIEYRVCGGFTGHCPKCAHSGEYANFRVLNYTHYSKQHSSGDKQETFRSYRLSDYHKKELQGNKWLALIRELAPGQKVRMNWEHRYGAVSPGMFSSYRPIVLLEKVE